MENYVKYLALFFIVMLAAGYTMSSFYPKFILCDRSFINPSTFAPGSQGDGTKKLPNVLLSDRGRMLIYVYSIVVALVITLAIYFLYARKAY
jgi:hypothetical protein